MRSLRELPVGKTDSCLSKTFASDVKNPEFSSLRCRPTMHYSSVTSIKDIWVDKDYIIRPRFGAFYKAPLCSARLSGLNARKQRHIAHHMAVVHPAREADPVEELENVDGQLAPGADAIA